MHPTGILRTRWNMPAQIQGLCLPPGSTELMPGMRSPSVAPFPQAMERAAAGRQRREPARDCLSCPAVCPVPLPVLSRCLAAPQHSEQHPGILSSSQWSCSCTKNPWTAGLWENETEATFSSSPRYLCSTPTPSTFSARVLYQSLPYPAHPNLRSIQWL